MSTLIWCRCCSLPELKYMSLQQHMAPMPYQRHPIPTHAGATMFKRETGLSKASNFAQHFQMYE